MRSSTSRLRYHPLPKEDELSDPHLASMVLNCSNEDEFARDIDNVLTTGPYLNSVVKLESQTSFYKNHLRSSSNALFKSRQSPN